MPNWTTNEIRFEDMSAEKIKEFFGSDDREFDFNRIIPMPKELDITSGGYQSRCMEYAEALNNHKRNTEPPTIQHSADVIKNIAKEYESAMHLLPFTSKIIEKINKSDEMFPIKRIPCSYHPNKKREI